MNRHPDFPSRPQASTLDIQEQFRAALVFHRGEKFAQARCHYEAILDIDPAHFDTLHQLAVLACQTHDLQEAEKFFLRAIQTGPRSSPVYRHYGLVLLILKRFDEALANFDQARAIDPDDAESAFHRGVALHELKRFDEALENFQNLITARPDHAVAHNSCGNAQAALQRFDDALVSYNMAISLNPNYADAYSNRGVALNALMRFDEAIASYQDAISINANHAEACSNLGTLLKKAGRRDQALTMFERATSINPAYAEAYSNRGNTLADLMRLEEAVEDYDKAISLRPDYAEAFVNRGLALWRLKRFEASVESYDQAISIAPFSPAPYSGRGNAFAALRRFDAALASYEMAIAIDPGDAETYSNRGNALNELRRFADAIACFETSLSIDPSRPEVHFNLGNTFAQMKRFDDALASFDTAVSLNPAFVEAHASRGNALKHLNRFVEATSSYKAALEIAIGGSESKTAVVDFLTTLSTLDFIPACFESVQQIETSIKTLERKLEECENAWPTISSHAQALQPIFTQFAFGLSGFHIGYTQKNMKEVMTRYSNLLANTLGVARTAIGESNSRGGPIRFGIASEALKSHNGANWAYDWLANLPEGYDFFTYAFNSDADHVTEQFSKLGTHRSLKFDHEHYSRSIEIMRSDQLDILMLPDVGMSASSRILSLHRIAPLQLTGWGHPVTTGSENIDFYLSSDLMEPEDAQSHYSETLVRLPNLALFLNSPETKAKSFLRPDLPQGHVLYGCLQSIYKYLPQYDFIYPRIAKATPEALFVFLEGEQRSTTEILKRRLTAVFTEYGLEAQKHVLFMPRVTTVAYTALVDDMDVILDTIGWSGGNTSLEAISLGKPLVTYRGEFMRGRHTSAMFRMMDMERHVACSLEDFITRAMELGSDGDARMRFSSELRRKSGLLYQDRQFTGALDGFFKREVAKLRGDSSSR